MYNDNPSVSPAQRRFMCWQYSLKKRGLPTIVKMSLRQLREFCKRLHIRTLLVNPPWTLAVARSVLRANGMYITKMGGQTYSGAMKHYYYKVGFVGEKAYDIANTLDDAMLMAQYRFMQKYRGAGRYWVV